MIEGSYIFGSKKVDIKKRFKYLGKKKLNDLLSKTGINFIYEAKKNEDSLSLAIKVTKKMCNFYIPVTQIIDPSKWCTSSFRNRFKKRVRCF